MITHFKEEIKNDFGTAWEKSSTRKFKIKLKKAKNKDYVSSELDESVLNFDDKISDRKDSDEKETEAQNEDMVAEIAKGKGKSTPKKT